MADIDWKEKYENLVRLLENDRGSGIYPIGHLTKEQQEEIRKKANDDYKVGWDDATMEDTKRYCGIMAQASTGVNEDLTMLLAADVGFLNQDGTISLNMNDTWGWALSWCPKVSTEQLEEVSRLFRKYGRAGLMYWHSCQENDMKSEFHDNNRMIEFVRNEERIKKEIPDSNRRAYHNASYTIGAEEKKEDSIVPLKPNRVTHWFNKKIPFLGRRKPFIKP